MFASIQLFLDGSVAADAALDVGTAVAARIGVQVRGLFIEDERRFQYFPPINAMSAALGAAPTIPVPLPVSEMAEIESAVREEGEAIRARFDAAASAAGLTASFSTVRGDVLDEMLEASHRTDMVLLGCRHAASSEGATDPGTRIEELLRLSNRPVILVPEKAQGAPDKVVMAFDRSDNARRVLREVAGLAKRAGASIDVVTVSSHDSEAEDALAEAGDYLAPWGLEVSTHRLKGRAREEILRHTKESGADLLAMGAFGHNRVSEFFFGSATRHILEHLPCPVLLSRH